MQETFQERPLEWLYKTQEMRKHFVAISCTFQNQVIKNKRKHFLKLPNVAFNPSQPSGRGHDFGRRLSSADSYCSAFAILIQFTHNQINYIFSFMVHLRRYNYVKIVVKRKIKIGTASYQEFISKQRGKNKLFFRSISSLLFFSS